MKRTGKIIALVSAVIVIGAVIAWFATADLREYRKGVDHLEAGEYSQAAQVFSALGDYEDAPTQLLEARYGIADQWMAQGAYTEAAEAFAALEGYADATERVKAARYAAATQAMEQEELLAAAQAFAALDTYQDSKELSGKCYYTLATNARVAADYALAQTYFESAGDYRDAALQAKRMIYSHGHQAFMEGDYDLSEQILAQLGEDEALYGPPHFETLADAAGYIHQQRENLTRQYSFCIGEAPGKQFQMAMQNYVQYHIGTSSYLEPNKQVNVYAYEYHDSQRILYAHETGDMSLLSEEEQKVLDLALALVEEAKSQTESDLEMEVWLHDWLCRQVVYESPDMDVESKDYLALRQLSCVGAMLDGKCNCQGYADAFYLLGNLAGLDVEKLTGETGEGHIWNLIRLDGLWYLVDVTFDDNNDDTYSGWTYAYFNVPLDTDIYEVWGGDIVPDLATTFAPEHTYYGLKNCLFTDVASAAQDLVSRRADDEQWLQAMVQGVELTSDQLSDAMDDALDAAGIYSARWWMYYDYNCGNTYISVHWVV